MNRFQFFVLTGLSSLVVLLLVGHVLLIRQVNIDQALFTRAQQQLSQAQVFEGNLRQLAYRIYNDSQKTQDPGLKDLVTREQITYNPAPANTNAAAAPAPVLPPAPR